MTYIPIPEERRRALAACIPDMAEARRRWGCELDAPTEPQFWTEYVLGIRKRSPAFPTNAAERLWLTRHAHLAVTGADPIRVPGFQWPGFCARTGRNAAVEGWPLEPIPGAKVPPTEPPNETPSPKRADECSVVIEGRVVKPGDTIYVKASDLGNDPKRTVYRVTVDKSGRYCVWFTNGYWRDPTDLTFVAPALRQAPSFDFGDPTTITVQQFHTQLQAAPTPSNLENTMNQAASLAFDASNIVAVKTFVFGHDIATLDDDTLLNYVQNLTGAIEHLEQLNAKTPLAKLVTKIDQLKDAKAKIVELLGGAPQEQATPAVDVDETKPKRVRRTKAEIEADNAAQARAETKAAPIPPAPPASKVDPDPNADMDIDYSE